MAENKMICVIRISGQTGLRDEMKDTLDRLRLKRKYACVVLHPTKENMGMVNKARNLVAFGEIDTKMFDEIVEKRGQKIDKSKKVDSKKAVEDVEKGKKFEDVNLKPFFRLHPPRGGIDAKVHFGKGKGVLGNNKDKINDLVRRML